MRILKMGVPLFKLGPACTVKHFFNIFTVYGTGHVWLFHDAKRVVVSFFLVKKINKMQVAS